MGKLNLTDLDMMAMFRVALEVARTDGNLTDNDFIVLDKYLQPLNMNENRTERLIKAAMMMDYQDAIEALKEMSPELKQYASNFLAEVVLSDGEVGDAENDAYERILDCCGLPFTTIGRDNSSDTAPQAKYSEQEIRAIHKAYLNVWDGSNAGKAIMLEFKNRYDVYGDSATSDSLSDDEVDSVLYVMDDEKKEEVSKMLLDVIVAKDPEDELMCDTMNIKHYYDLVVRTGLPDLLTGQILDYKSENDSGLPDGLRFTILDLYAVWSIVDTCFNMTLTFVFDEFFSAYYVDPNFFIDLRNDCYLKENDIRENAERISRLGRNERECVSLLLAKTIYNNDGIYDDITGSLDVYKALVVNFGLTDHLDIFFDGHGISEYRIDKKAVVNNVEIEPDLFIDGMSQTKIKVTVRIKGCKDGELRCIASVYHADDDSPVPAPDFDAYGKYGWYYDDVDVLSAMVSLSPSYDDSVYTDLELLIPNDFLPKDRDYYLKVYVFDIEDQVFISYPSHVEKHSFKATKNEWDPDEALLEETYMVVRYNKSRNYFFDTVPNSSYTPCTVDFVTIPLGKTLNDVVKSKDLRYKDADKTPDLNAISRSLDLSLPNRDDMTLAILFDAEGAVVPNPLQSLAGNVASESMIICLRTPDGYVSGFVKRRQLRDVLVAFEKHIDRDRSISGILASNKSFNDSMEAKRLVTRKFWSEINSSFYQLKYRVKKSRSVIEVSNKSAQIEKVSYNPNVMINGVSYTRFTLNFVVNGCKGVKCTCECTIRDGGKNHMAISCDEIKYCGYFEHICLHQEFTPGYDSTRYSEFNVEVPNRILNKWKDLVGLIRVEFFTYDGYAPIKITTSQDFTLKI